MVMVIVPSIWCVFITTSNDRVGTVFPRECRMSQWGQVVMVVVDVVVVQRTVCKYKHMGS